MNYRKLEAKLITLGLVVIFGSMLIGLKRGTGTSEILGQALFVPVLFFSLHYGRQAGFLAATIAAVAYMIARVQELQTLNISSLDAQQMILRLALFGFVGIFASELASRSKYLKAKFANTGGFDEETKLFTQDYLQKRILKLFYEHDRYDRPFSMLFITVTEDHALVKNVKGSVSKFASLLRDNVRLVDEVGYVSSDCFCVLLPDTNKAGAELVFKRLDDVFLAKIGKSLSSTKLHSRIYCSIEDEAEIKQMLPSEAIARSIA